MDMAKVEPHVMRSIMLYGVAAGLCLVPGTYS
jgi:hypothetical protein